MGTSKESRNEEPIRLTDAAYCRLFQAERSLERRFNRLQSQRHSEQTIKGEVSRRATAREAVTFYHRRNDLLRVIGALTKYEIVRLIYDPVGTIEVWTGSTSFPSEDLGLVEDLIDLIFPPRKYRNGAGGKNTRLKNHFYYGEAIAISRLTSSPGSTSTSSGRTGSSRIGNI